MTKTPTIAAIALGLLLAAGARADCNNDCDTLYTNDARAALFPLSISGATTAYNTLETAMADGNCNTCPDIVFMHALARVVMLFTDNGDVLVNDGLFEIAEAFGITITGDILTQLDVVIPDMKDGSKWVFPANSPDADALRDIIDNQILPVIDEILADLENFPNPDGPAWTFVLTDDETGAGQDIEVDYGDILLFKAMLYSLKATLEYQSPWNFDMGIDQTALNNYLRNTGLGEPQTIAEFQALLNIFSLDIRNFIQNNIPIAALNAPDPFDVIDIEDLWSKFSLNTYLFGAYPNWGMLNPTAGYLNVDGPTVLAQLKADILNIISIYNEAIQHITHENVPEGTDPQDDELIYIDPNYAYFANHWHTLINDVNNALTNDTTFQFTLETTFTYDIFQGAEKVATLTFELAPGAFVGQWGLFELEPGVVPGLPSPWTVVDVETGFFGDPIFAIDMVLWDGPQQNQIGWGYIDVEVSADGQTITDGVLVYNYWGEGGPAEGQVDGLTGELTNMETEQVTINPNPFFGDSPTYPDPVHIRHLFPELTNKNEFIRGTMGHGLDNDPTLGGILPDMAQDDWEDIFRFVAGPAKPNLDITNPNTDPVDPVRAKVGSTVNINVTVLNNGPGKASQFDLTLYRSGDQQVDNTDTAIAVRTIRSLNSGAQTTQVMSFVAPATVGTWYLAAMADSGRGVSEVDETDNWSGVITFQTEPINRDLTGTIATTFVNGAKGGDVGNVNVLVRNNGNDLAEGVIAINIYASANTTYEEGVDALLTTVTAKVKLAPGASKLYQYKKVALPAVLAPGAYFFLAHIDATGVITPDNDLDNNVVATDATVNVAEAHRDLIPSNLATTFPNGAKPGDVGDFTFNIRNAGNLPVRGTIDVDILASADQALGDDTLVTTKPVKIKLAANGIVTVTIKKVALPALDPAVDVFFLVHVDSGENVDESNEDNNVASTAAAIDINRPNVDLAGVLANLGANVPVGAKVTFNLTVTNNGAGAVKQKVRIQIWASADAAYDLADTLIVNVETNLRLKAGAPKRLKLKGVIPPGLNGAYHFIALIDTANVLAEFDETNNEAATPGTTNIN
ncbi:MAG TPA: hypothetical protein ENN81_02730 [Phycisphaerales bacterium]|nr:hypothetical protein [Phycisphaerales bacterium]